MIAYITSLLTATDAGSSMDPNILAQYGVLGIFAAMLVWFARISYKRETDRSDRLEAEVQRLNALIQDKIVPAIGSATRAVEEAQELLRVMTRERVELHMDRRRRARLDEGEIE